ncbi:MAG: hypothetical protein ACRDL4_05720, partial [Thermoleophilaceae bacterium]
VLAVAALAAAGGVSLGGDDLPDGAVAMVGDAVISRAEFDRAARELAPAGMGAADGRAETEFRVARCG